MQQHIAACKASGKSVESYCNEHQVKPHIYYYWRKKLQPQQRVGKFISIAPQLYNSAVSIVFTNGNRICFETMPPADYVKQLMS
jgi:transposase-like protein